jgi:lipoate-protein ligase A
MQHSHRFPVGGIDVRLQVEKGKIDDVNIYGDFFGVGDVTVVEESLKGVQYDRESITKALDAIDIPTILGGITKEEFINLIY